MLVWYLRKNQKEHTHTHKNPHSQISVFLHTKGTFFIFTWVSISFKERTKRFTSDRDWVVKNINTDTHIQYILQWHPKVDKKLWMGLPRLVDTTKKKDKTSVNKQWYSTHLLYSTNIFLFILYFLWYWVVVVDVKFVVSGCTVLLTHK